VPARYPIRERPCPERDPARRPVDVNQGERARHGAQFALAMRGVDLAGDPGALHGAIALRHPFGMTGARITTTLAHPRQDHRAQHDVRRRRLGMAMVLEWLR
jgi:hypothetical protein